MTKIPSVNKGDKIATIVPATEGKEGTDVFGNPIRQKKKGSGLERKQEKKCRDRGRNECICCNC